MKLQILRENVNLPKIATDGSACADLYCCSSEKVLIQPGQTKFFPLGFATEFDESLVALVFARSGLATKRGINLANGVAVIDSDYRGEWVVALHNNGVANQEIEPGERIAQMLLIHKEVPSFDVVEELTDTNRGTGGFGSTG